MVREITLIEKAGDGRCESRALVERDINHPVWHCGWFFVNPGGSVRWKMSFGPFIPSE
jgi:hypothetical protein